ncbi:hypothetical protein TNCV_1661841 [Trichonephila clavipes]|nr:hypothetical protein TNCV_1661841 [Trichonephila clavipes]
MNCLHGDHYSGFSGHFGIETRVDREISNVKTMYNSGVTRPFQTSPGSVRNIMMDISVSKSTKNTRSLNAFDIAVGDLLMM